jgi:choice-of-anchor B domain-containing protein
MKQTHHESRFALVLVLTLLSSPALAHDDDPKLLDKQGPYLGQGFRAAWAGQPAARTGAVHARLRSTTGAGGQTIAMLGPDTSFTPPVDFASSGAQLLSWMPLPEFGASMTNGNDCWGYVSPGGREYALMGLSHGTGIVDVTQPDDAQLLTVIPGPISFLRDIKTYQDYAYIVSEGGEGIQVIDLSQIDAGIVTHVGDVTGPGSTTSTHNVAIDEVSGRLYRTGGDNHGLRIYDLSDPAAPTFLNSWDDRYVHDAQVVTYTSGPFADKQIAFCASGFNGGWIQTGVDILDVTDPLDIQLLNRFFYPNPGYSHQCWLNHDLSLLYLNDEVDEKSGLPTTTHAIDVTDPANPFMAGTFTNGNTSSGHNLYVNDGLLYEANFRSGLRVFDVFTNPTNPPEIAWFDVYPQDDENDFNGLWSVYPFLPSGIVLGSDIEKGLFVWWVGPSPLIITPTEALPQLLDPDGFAFTVTITERTPGDLVPGTPALHYDAGGGWQTVPLTHLEGELYRAELPAMACGLDVPYYVSAQSVHEITWTAPSVAAGLTWRGQVALDRTVALEHDMETPQGWTSGAPGDDATSGLWTRDDPLGTDAQPGTDHSIAGTDCWFTGQGAPSGSVGDNDVDDGTATLLSPVLDLTALSEPNIAYWRWYVNTVAGSPAADDTMTIDISNDGGSSWTSVEVLSPVVQEQVGAWIQTVFRVADYVEPSSQVRMRFQVSDLNDNSIVEAAIDDFQVLEVLCADCDGDGSSDGMEILGGASDGNGNGVPDACDPDVSAGPPVARGTGTAPPAGGPAALPVPPVLGPISLPPLLSSVIPVISVRRGGEQQLSIDAGVARAGHAYLLLGSFSGTTPGVSLPRAVVPLNLDAYMRFTFRHRNTAPLHDTFGTLDEAGRAHAVFALPPGSDPALVGLTVFHALLVFDGAIDPTSVVYVSDPVPLRFVP